MTLASGAPPNASDTIRCPRRSKAKPNGVAPAEACDSITPGRPLRPTSYVSIRLVSFSVTTSSSPLGSNDTWAGPGAAVLSGRVERASGDRCPDLDTVNPLMFALPPAFSAYSRPRWTVRLIGWSPPDASVSSRSRPSRLTSNAEIESLPGLTANRCLPSSTTALWLSRPPPVPSPPVANSPAGVRDPSPARSNAFTALPAGLLVSVYTSPPNDAIAPLASAANAASANARAIANAIRLGSTTSDISSPPRWLDSRGDATRPALPDP